MRSAPFLTISLSVEQRQTSEPRLADAQIREEHCKAQRRALVTSSAYGETPQNFP
jgi:hypothetical protein